MSLFDDSTPSLSFKDAPIGTSYTGTVTRAPEMVQSRDYDTGEPAFWPASPDGKANPKMSVVFNLQLPDGTERSVWAPKPSALFSALGAAEKASGKAIGVGDTVTIAFTGTEPSSKGARFADKKLYTVTHVPGSVFSEAPAQSAPSAPAAAPQAAGPAPVGATPPGDVASLAAALLAAQPLTQPAAPQHDPVQVEKAKQLLAYNVPAESVAQACGLPVEFVRTLT